MGPDCGSQILIEATPTVPRRYRRWSRSGHPGASPFQPARWKQRVTVRRLEDRLPAAGHIREGQPQL